MLYTLALTNNSEVLQNVSLERLSMNDVLWYWVDFESPEKEEIELLSSHFKFNDLSIEDCLEHLERPKVDYYDSYTFFVLHALDQNTLDPLEVDIFVGQNYVVSFHNSKIQEIDIVRQKVLEKTNYKREGHIYITYFILDKIVDFYFPAVYRLEDYLNEIDIRLDDKKIHNLIDKVFEIRTDLLKLRHIINSMKELLYRILNSEHMAVFRENKRHINDIYDHLLILYDIVESNREVTSDVRDNYISINSHRMNKIMTIFTVITSIFIPLTFIVGIYGMNFDYMPELRWHYGYFFVLGIMLAIGISLILWFRHKGWFDIKK